MTRVFISYRRADSRADAEAIVEALGARRGLSHKRGVVFLDEKSIEPGEDWRQRLTSEVAGADWLVALIGPQWLAPAADGRPRILQRDDLVRVEIASALKAGTPILPVRVGGGEVPDVWQLPRDVAMLTRVQALTWPQDAARITSTVNKRARLPGVLVPPALVGTWVHAQATLGATYEFSADGTYSHMGVTEQRSPGEVYRFEIWEEGVAVVSKDRLSLQPFRASASQSSSDGSRPSYKDSARELVNRELRWQVGGGGAPVLQLETASGEVTRFEFQGRLD